MSMFSIHFQFFYLLLQKKGRFLSILYTSVYEILNPVFFLYVMSLFPIYLNCFMVFLCVLCILLQGTMVEQLCLNGFTLHKYIRNKKK